MSEQEKIDEDHLLFKDVITEAKAKAKVDNLDNLLDKVFRDNFPTVIAAHSTDIFFDLLAANPYLDTIPSLLEVEIKIAEEKQKLTPLPDLKDMNPYILSQYKMPEGEYEVVEERKENTGLEDITTEEDQFAHAQAAMNMIKGVTAIKTVINDMEKPLKEKVRLLQAALGIVQNMYNEAALDGGDAHNKLYAVKTVLNQVINTVTDDNIEDVVIEDVVNLLFLVKLYKAPLTDKSIALYEAAFHFFEGKQKQQNKSKLIEDLSTDFKDLHGYFKGALTCHGTNCPQSTIHQAAAVSVGANGGAKKPLKDKEKPKKKKACPPKSK